MTSRLPTKASSHRTARPRRPECSMERRLRLRQDHDVRAARSRGQALAEGPIVLRYLRNGTAPPTNRYAVVAGRRTGGAVERNRLKRVVREALRNLHPELSH